jgi:hypothetical protein
MIARLFGIPSESKETETSNKEVYNAVDIFRNKDLAIKKSGILVSTFRPESILNEKKLTVTKEVSEIYYPTRGVVTVGVLMSVVGLLVFSPIILPSIYRIVGGLGFFIMGISVVGNGLLNSRKNRETKAEEG